jgi:hypothetical protein
MLLPGTDLAVTTSSVWMLTLTTQTRGAQKGQGCRLLRAQEGCPPFARRGPEERQGRREGQDRARFLRILNVAEES